MRTSSLGNHSIIIGLAAALLAIGPATVADGVDPPLHAVLHTKIVDTGYWVALENSGPDDVTVSPYFDETTRLATAQSLGWEAFVETGELISHMHAFWGGFDRPAMQIMLGGAQLAGAGPTTTELREIVWASDDLAGLVNEVSVEIPPGRSYMVVDAGGLTTAVSFLVAAEDRHDVTAYIVYEDPDIVRFPWSDAGNDWQEVVRISTPIGGLIAGSIDISVQNEHNFVWAFPMALRAGVFRITAPAEEAIGAGNLGPACFNVAPGIIHVDSVEWTAPTGLVIPTLQAWVRDVPLPVDPTFQYSNCRVATG